MDACSSINTYSSMLKFLFLWQFEFLGENAFFTFSESKICKNSKILLNGYSLD